DNVNAINEHGLQANFDGEQVVAKIKAYEQTKIDPSAVADLVILFPKSMQLDGMMQSLKPVITDHTKILCLMNGIGHEEIIEKY
ncbi:ketopantoate reductase family protein, partial [Lacticaseibacillus paracasei]